MPKSGKKSAFFCPMWPRNLTDDLEKQQGTLSNLLPTLCIISLPLVNSSWSNSPEMSKSGRNRWFFVPCDLEIWWMTLKNNRTPLPCCFKLFASFHSHRSIQAAVTVQKHHIWVKIVNFLPCVTLKFDWWPWKTTGYLFCATSSFVHDFIAICEF